MEFAWGYIEEGRPASGDVWPVTDRGHRLFVIRDQAIDFPDRPHWPGWFFTRVSARGYLTIEQLEYVTSAQDCVSSDGVRFEAENIVLYLKLPSDLDTWREVIRRRLGIEADLRGAVAEAFRRASKLLDYKSLRMRDSAACLALQDCVARRVGEVTPYLLKAMSFDSRSAESAIDRTIDGANHAEVAEREGEPLRIQAAKNALREHEAQKEGLERRDELENMQHASALERAEKTDDYERRRAEQAWDFEKRKLEDLLRLYPNAAERLMTLNPTLYAEIEKARILQDGDHKQLQGQVKAFRAMIGQGDLATDRSEMKVFMIDGMAKPTDPEPGGDNGA